MVCRRVELYCEEKMYGKKMLAPERHRRQKVEILASAIDKHTQVSEHGVPAHMLHKITNSTNIDKL